MPTFTNAVLLAAVGARQVYRAVSGAVLIQVGSFGDLPSTSITKFRVDKHVARLVADGLVEPPVGPGEFSLTAEGEKTVTLTALNTERFGADHDRP